MAAGHRKEEGKGRKGVKGELRRKWGKERAKNRRREGSACAHARQLVGALRGRLGRRPLLSRQARAVAQSSRAPFALSLAPARRCRRRGGGGTRRARVTFPLPPSWCTATPRLRRRVGSSGGKLPGESACQSVGRSSRRPSPSPFSGGGTVESAPGIPRWGRSGDGGSGITEPERERPRGPVPRGGHGRPSPRPQPGRHRPVRPAGERAAPQPRPASRPRRRGAGWLHTSRAPWSPPPPAPSPSATPAPFPGARRCWAPAPAPPLSTRCRFWEPVRSPPCGAPPPRFLATSTFTEIPDPLPPRCLRITPGSPKLRPPSPAESLLWSPPWPHTSSWAFPPLPLLISSSSPSSFSVPRILTLQLS